MSSLNVVFATKPIYVHTRFTAGSLNLFENLHFCLAINSFLSVSVHVECEMWCFLSVCLWTCIPYGSICSDWLFSQVSWFWIHFKKRQHDIVIWKKEQPHFRHNLLINDNNNKLWWNINEHISFDNSCWLIESNSYTNVNEKQHLHSCLWYSKGKVIYHIKSSSKSYLPWTKHNELSIKALKASIHFHNKLRLRWPIRTYNTSHPAEHCIWGQCRASLSYTTSNK